MEIAFKVGHPSSPAERGNGKGAAGSRARVDKLHHLELLPHHRRMGEGLELPQPLRRGGVGRFSFEREQPGTGSVDEEVMLVGETPLPQPFADGGELDPGEVDMGGDVLLAGEGEGVVSGTVLPVAAQGAAGALRQVVVGPLVAVVDDPPEAAIEKAGRLRHPHVDGGADFGKAAFGESVSERRREVGEFRAQLARDPGRPVPRGVPSDPTFPPAASLEDEKIDGKGVEKLVAEEDSLRSLRGGERIDDAERPLGSRRQPLLQHLAQRVPRLDETVFQPFEKRRADFAETGEEIPGEPSVVRTLLDEDEGQGPGEGRLPLPLDPMGEKKPEEIPHRDTRVEIPLAAHFAESGARAVPRVVAMAGLVERQIHPCRKRDRLRRTFRNSLKDEIEKGRILGAGQVSRSRAHASHPTRSEPRFQNSSVPRDYEEIDFDAIGHDDAPVRQRPVIDLPPLDERARDRAKRRRRFVFWAKFLGFFAVLGLVAVLVGAAGAFFYLKPRYDLAQTFDLSLLEEVEVASRIFDRNGKELGRIFVQNRRPVSLDNVSDHFVHALLAAEDSRFYQHEGVDYLGIARALYYGLRSKNINQGASTITQQLARQTFELKDRTLSRKFTEIFLAQRIEKRIGSKQRILELYINRIYFGSGYYGIASASEGYFGKDPEHLSVVEAATLAATIPNPYHRSPRSFPEVSKKWRDHILARMAVEGYIDKDTRDRLQNTRVEIAAKTNITGRSAFVYEKVRQEVIELLGYEAVSKGGFSIHTTIDGGLQEFAENALREQLAKIEQHPDFKQETLEQYKAKKAAFQESAHPDQTFPAPKYLQGALLLLDNKTGAVLARVSGRDFNDSMFDRVSQGRRPTGTAFKPFVYAAAFEAGYFPGTLVDDTPMDTRQVMVGGTTGILGEWGVETFDNVYENVITARRALARGKNAATVRLGQKVGTEAVVALARKAGMRFEGELQKFNATFLGRNPSSLEEFGLAYTIFPNNGRRAERPHIIANIRDSLGNVIYTPNVAMHSGQAIDRYTAHQVNSMLSDTFSYGTAAKAHEKYGLGQYPVAGKTGTEYDFTDNWFAGYTTEVTCVAWVGFDQSGTIYPGAFSSDTVLPVWAAVMNEAAKKFEPKAFLPPPDAAQVEICLKSGELASDDCYEVVQKSEGIASQVRCTYTEYLRPGTSLEKICHIHGRGRSRLQKQLTQKRTKDGLIRPDFFVQENAQPVLPVAPTVIGTNDPYNSFAPVLRARVAPVVAEVVGETPAEGGGTSASGEPIGSNGIPVARPVLTETATEDLPAQRVQLPRPRAIEFE